MSQQPQAANWSVRSCTADHRAIASLTCPVLRQGGPDYTDRVSYYSVRRRENEGAATIWRTEMAANNSLLIDNKTIATIMSRTTRPTRTRTMRALGGLRKLLGSHWATLGQPLGKPLGNHWEATENSLVKHWEATGTGWTESIEIRYWKIIFESY